VTFFTNAPVCYVWMETWHSPYLDVFPQPATSQLTVLTTSAGNFNASDHIGMGYR